MKDIMEQICGAAIDSVFGIGIIIIFVAICGYLTAF